MSFHELSHELKGHYDPVLLYPTNSKFLSRDDLHIFAGTWYTDIGTCSCAGENFVVKIWRGQMERSLSRFTKRLLEELTRWRALQHPNITPFIGIIFGMSYLPALALPYYVNGNAPCYIRNNPDTNVFRLLYGVAGALSYMHKFEPPICHGGVRGSNILISVSGEACLTDIGINAIPRPQDYALPSFGLDEYRWMAPEIIDPPNSEYDSSTDCGYDMDVIPVTTRSDVYSFGMTALELYSGRYPFSTTLHFTGVMRGVLSGIRPQRPDSRDCPAMTDGMWMLIESCWNHCPHERPSIDAVMSWLDLLQAQTGNLENPL